MPVENFLTGWRGSRDIARERSQQDIMRRRREQRNNPAGLRELQFDAIYDPDLSSWLARDAARLDAGYRVQRGRQRNAFTGGINAFAGSPASVGNAFQPATPQMPVLPPPAPQQPGPVSLAPPAPVAPAVKPDASKQSAPGAPFDPNAAPARTGAGSVIGNMVGAGQAQYERRNRPPIDLPSVPPATGDNPTTGQPWQFDDSIRVGGVTYTLQRDRAGRPAWVQRDVGAADAQAALDSSAPAAAPAQAATAEAPEAPAAPQGGGEDIMAMSMKVAPPALSRNVQDLMVMRDAYAEAGFHEDVADIEDAIETSRTYSMELYGARLTQMLSIVPMLRQVPPQQRAQRAMQLLQSSPYAQDIDGQPIVNDQAIQLVQQAAQDGQITDQELDQVEQMSLTYAERLDEAFRNRQLAQQGSDRPLTNTERRVMAQQYRTEVRRTVDELGILRPALPYARLALSHSGDTTSVPGVNFRQADVALLRAAARAQTGPGVLTESEVWSTLSPSLQQRLTTGMAYLDISRAGVSATDRAALAQFVMQSAGNVQRDAWDIYDAYEAQWGADVLAQNGVQPPRIPHPDDEPYLQAQGGQNPQRGSFWSVNGRTYRYDGPGAWTIMNSGDSVGDAQDITADPVDPGQQVMSDQQQRLVFAAIQQRRSSGNFVASMRRTWREAGNREAFRAALQAAITEGLLSEREYREITGETPMQDLRRRGGPQL